MADVQIAVIDQQNTQIALAAPSETQVNAAVPGVQGPAGEGVPQGGTANQVLFKQSGTDYDTTWGEVTSAMIGDLEIVNADVSASAAIAGTKISPNFGSQNVVTTGKVGVGTSTPGSYYANKFVIDIGASAQDGITIVSGPTANGMLAFADGISGDQAYRGYINYNHASDYFTFNTAATERLRIDSSGRVGIGSAPTARLDVRREDTDGVIAEFHQSSGYGIDIGSSVSVAYISSGYVQSLVFKTDPSSGQVERARIDSSGRLLVGTSSDSGGALLQVNGDRVRIATAKTPASASATGTAGEVCWDTNYIYVCTATNTWKRAALSTW